jgi:arylsulfatase A-like enzyme
VRRFEVLLLLLLLLACGAEREARRNLLLISIDTLRADHLSAYGYERETSPAIDALAGEGVLFENPIAQRGSTWPSLTSILTSMYPRSHGVRSNGVQLEASKRILAEWLQERGYATGAFLTNMTTAPNRGFDVKPELPKGADRDLRATQAALRWIREQRERPFFAWLHLMAPHHPYRPRGPRPAGFDTGYRGELDGSHETLHGIYKRREALSQAELAHIVSLYDADVLEADGHVGLLLDGLDRAELAESTLVVLVSDHGEELYEHNHYFFHSNSIYQSVLRVPLILRLPGVLPAGLRVPDVIETVDIAPTVLELLGIPRPSGFEGRSLTERIFAGGVPAPGDAAAFSELGPGIASMRTERWHYIHNPDGLTSPGTAAGDEGHEPYFRIERGELYDVIDDPRETRNLVRERPEVAASLRRRLETWLGGREGHYRVEALSPETEAELRALGYLDTR